MFWTLLTADALTFAAPLWLLAALGSVPAALALFTWAERRAARRLARLIAARLRPKLAGADSPGRRRARFALLVLGLAALGVALARPQWGFEEQQVKRRGLDLLVAVDVSKSMLANDLPPSRLGRARLAILDLLGLLPGDRVGLIAFAGTAFLQAPLTIDYDAARAAVGELDTELIPRGGTNISAAVDLALDAFGKAEGGNRAIILFTDGEELEEDAVKAAGRAAAAGVKVFTVGLGSADGSLIPLPRGSFGGSGPGGDFVRDRSGALVRSKLDENRLQQIASAGGGQYVHLTNASGQADMKTLVERGLSALQAGEIDARVSRRPIERYQWPLGAALLALGASTLLGERRRASRSAAVPTAVAALRAVVFLLAFQATARAATNTKPGDPLELYQEGRYEEAYRSYDELLKKNPKSGKLQFNAGSSAYQAGQYDPALEAFSHALSAPDVDAGLQAKTFYNLGNTLFKRGEAQKDGSDERVKDWKNAIQYYNSVLQAKAAPGRVDPSADPLRRDAEHNRDLAQKRLDAELKKREQQQKSQPPPQKSGGKKDDDQKKDSKAQKQNQPPKSDPSKSDQQNSPKPNGGQGKNDQPGQAPPKDPQPGQSGSSDQPPQPKDQRGSRDSKEPGSEGQKPDGKQPNDRPPESGPGGDQPPTSSNGGPGEQNPPPEPQGNGERPQGDLTARGKNSQASPAPEPAEPAENPAEAGQAANGKMTAGQARALLNALRGEDDKVLNNPNARKQSREPVYNDW